MTQAGLVALHKYPYVHLILQCAAHASRRFAAGGTVKAIYQLACEIFWLWWKLYVIVLGDEFCHMLTCAAAKHDQVHQRVAANAISAIHDHAAYPPAALDAAHP